MMNPIGAVTAIVLALLASPAFAFYDSLECKAEANIGLAHHTGGTPTEMYISPIFLYGWDKAFDELAGRPEEQLLLLKRVHALIPFLDPMDESNKSTTRLISDYSAVIKEVDEIYFKALVLSQGTSRKVFADQFVPCTGHITQEYEDPSWTCISDNKVMDVKLLTLEFSMASFGSPVLEERYSWVAYGKCEAK